MPVSASSSRKDAPPLPLTARRHPLIAEVERAMRLRCGFGLEGPLVVGVSGGSDSLGLLVACAVFRERSDRAAGFEPVAVHVNHHLRDSVDDDAQHVAAVCERLGVPCEVMHIAPRELPGNVSANARELRYGALLDAAKSLRAAHVAAAHHAEDQLETILAALCRGTGVEGAAGMRWARPLGEGVALIRPLLSMTKADCVSLCEAAGVEWREDPTNEDVAFARARLRRDVLPVLEELWPGAAQRASGAADVIAVAAEALEEKLAAVFGDAARREWDRRELADHPAALIAAGLRRAALDSGESNDEVLQRQLITAAEAIRDDERRPRTFAIGRSTNVQVTAAAVAIDIQSVARASRLCE